MSSRRRRIRLPEIPLYQHFFDGEKTRAIIEWIKRVAECVEECGLTPEDREFLDLLRDLLDLQGGTINLQGFNVEIQEDKGEFPSTGNTFTLYVVDNDRGSLLYVWDDELRQYRLIMQSPKTIEVIRGGNASG